MKTFRSSRQPESVSVVRLLILFGIVDSLVTATVGAVIYVGFNEVITFIMPSGY